MAGAFEGKVVLVAGVGGGLGAALVSLLASEGATVVAVARRASSLDPITVHARTRGWKVVPRTADVTDAAQVDRLVAATVGELGGIDAMSVDVGHWIPDGGLLHELTQEAWTAGVRDNLEATYQMGRAVLPHMIERHRGSIVLVSAALAIRWAASASYCAAKGGLVDLVPKLARDYRALGVRFNAVLPGAMTRSLGGLDPPVAGGAVPLTDQTTTSPWEVARAIRYLLSDESRWVTGATITVDGGASTAGAEPRPA
jgi:NAD(P)-dependent dehydrogenase (short-subunit alcohol dehydrogenase family)